jgi:hypothetical protein
VDASGATYLFQRSGDAWPETAELTGGDTSRFGWFGYAVALDGDHALIGAPFDEDDGVGTGSGYVYLK